MSYSGFKCADMNETQSTEYASQQACITGYCGGDDIHKYCANPDKYTGAVNAVN
jgi:hypothetical protein